MRDLMFGMGGFAVGGTVGVVGLLAVEALAAVVVAGLLFAAPPAPPELAIGAVPAAPVEVSAPVASTAAPGEVQLHALTMSRVLLDGEPMTWVASTGTFTDRVAPGAHRLQILETLGTAVKTEATVVVESGKRTQLRLTKGQLVSQGTMPLASRTAAPVESASVVVSAGVEGASVSVSADGASVTASAGPTPVRDAGEVAQAVFGAVKLPKLSRR